MKRCLENQLPMLPFLLLIAACTAALAPRAAHGQVGPVQRGEEIFQAKCTACHTIGGGRKVGPDLQGVTKEQLHTWLFSFISDPDRMFAANDPHAMMLLNKYKIKMPNMGLSPDDVNAVINYLAAAAGEAPAAQAAPITGPASGVPPAAGNPAKGEGYFNGRLPFQNGGPPCMACHSVSGMKYLGGGTLGPDLTTAYASLGGGIVSLLVHVPFPTMKPIFDSHPLTEAEAGDLAAFLQTTASRQPEFHTGRITAASLLVFVVLMIAIHALWRKRLVSVRKALVERAEREGGNR